MNIFLVEVENLFWLGKCTFWFCNGKKNKRKKNGFYVWRQHFTWQNEMLLLFISMSFSQKKIEFNWISMSKTLFLHFLMRKEVKLNKNEVSQYLKYASSPETRMEQVGTLKRKRNYFISETTISMVQVMFVYILITGNDIKMII